MSFSELIASVANDISGAKVNFSIQDAAGTPGNDDIMSGANRDANNAALASAGNPDVSRFNVQNIEARSFAGRIQQPSQGWSLS